MTPKKVFDKESSQNVKGKIHSTGVSTATTVLDTTVLSNMLKSQLGAIWECQCLFRSISQNQFYMNQLEVAEKLPF